MRIPLDFSVWASNEIPLTRKSDERMLNLLRRKRTGRAGLIRSSRLIPPPALQILTRDGGNPMRVLLYPAAALMIFVQPASPSQVETMTHCGTPGGFWSSTGATSCLYRFPPGLHAAEDIRASASAAFEPLGENLFRFNVDLQVTRQYDSGQCAAIIGGCGVNSGDASASLVLNFFTEGPARDGFILLTFYPQVEGVPGRSSMSMSLGPYSATEPFSEMLPFRLGERSTFALTATVETSTRTGYIFEAGRLTIWGSAYVYERRANDPPGHLSPVTIHEEVPEPAGLAAGGLAVLVLMNAWFSRRGR
jgi:hypothetical protein